VVEHLKGMVFARMIIKKVAIDGIWLNLYFYEEEDGVRIEVEQQVLGKRHKVFPDNKIKLEDFS